MTDENDNNDEERENKYDVFKVGDRVPWFGGYGIVTEVEEVDELPEDLPPAVSLSDFSPVKKGEVKPVMVTVDLPEQHSNDEMTVPSEWLFKNLNESFDEHGLPSVSAESGLGAADAPTIGVQTPATGNNSLSQKEARRLAGFLRTHADFEPLYALLGRVDSQSDMMSVADALDRAATVKQIAERQD